MEELAEEVADAVLEEVREAVEDEVRAVREENAAGSVMVLVNTVVFVVEPVPPVTLSKNSCVVMTVVSPVADVANAIDESPESPVGA